MYMKKHRRENSSTDRDDSRTSQSSERDENEDDWVEENPAKEKGLPLILFVNSFFRTVLD